MLYKPRCKSTELLKLASLNLRMSLPEKIRQHYLNLEKGYEGECLFDSLTEKLQCDCLILNDLLLKANQTIFQIDSLIITANKIYCYEIKNMKGDYYYDDDKFFNITNIECINPLHQMTRASTLLNQILRVHGFRLPIEGFLVFINNEFTLLQAPLNKPIIHPTQIKQHLKTINTLSNKLNKKHKQLADKLVSLHIVDSPFSQLPTYNYEDLQKGITCYNCGSFSINIRGQKCICTNCTTEERVDHAIRRSAKEFQLLFPNKKITTHTIYNWCQIVNSKQRIYRVLNQHFKQINSRRWTYYK
ncbi:nuclease-related domain-containing protein [Amphibacillus sp. Q70]|uniref:nuclease-related domain-containing protein n=1 Tax=Amphibacillus sp. Q70 TaxID=3453416 RepID=UPI003F8730FC